MKKIKLLLVAFAAMVSLGVNAQTWTGSDPAAGTFFLYNVGTKTFINVGDKSAGWGTNAYLTAEYGLDFTFEINQAAYNLNSRVTNGGDSHYLNTALWCDQGATPWTFTKVDRTDINAYTISNEGKYIVANAAGTDVEYTALSGTERDQWQIIGSTDILDNLNANTASGVNRTQATFFISDPDFGRNDQRRSNWSYTNSGGNVTVPGAGVSQGTAANYGCEFWNNTFDIHQNISNLPNGIYEFEISGFGTNGTTYIYATTASGTTEKVFKNQTGAANFQTALNNIDNYSGNATGLVQVTDGTLTIGVKRENNSNQDWCVIDQARLYYYGDYTFAECYGADLSALITTAQGLVAEAPIAALVNELSTAISTAQDVMANGQTEEDFANGQTALQSAVDTYNAKLTFLANYLTARTTIVANRDDNSIYTDANDAVATLNSAISTQDAAAVAATSAEEVAACVTALTEAYVTFVKAVTVNEGKYFDMTNIWIVNPTVSANVDGWTTANKVGGNGPTTNYGETEFYNATFDFYQTLTLPRGTYEFGVTGFHRAGNHATYFYAGEDKILIPGVESSVVNTMAAAKTYFDNGNGKVTLKFALENENNTINIGIVNNDTETDKWTIFRNFTLHFYGSAVDYSVYETQWNTLVETANTVKTNSDYANVTGAELTALNEAIADAPDGSSKANYIAKIDALETAIQVFTAAKTNYDLYVSELAIAQTISSTITADAPTTSAEALAAFKTLKVAEYNFVATAYPYSATSKIGEFSTWTRTGTVNGNTKNEFEALTSQHWSGTERTYYEQPKTGWDNNAWTANYTKTTTLPAGDYIIKVAARAASSGGTTASITCQGLTAPIPTLGDTGKGITTAGVASFDEGTFANDGKGRGWVWNYLPFTLTEETEVTMTVVAEATGTYQWFSVCDGELLSKNNIATAVAYDETATNTIEDVDVANVTVSRAIKEGFNTVVLPFDLTSAQVLAAFGQDTEVYAFSDEQNTDGNVKVNFNKVVAGTISANVPVLVKATAASSVQEFNGVEVVAGEAKDEGNYFDFVGVYNPTTVEADDWFIGNGALYKSAGTTNIKAFRAYLDNKGDAVEARIFIEGVETTGIEGLMKEESQKAGAVYDLQGRKVANPSRGLYIINGKKVIVK